MWLTILYFRHPNLTIFWIPVIDITKDISWYINAFILLLTFSLKWVWYSLKLTQTFVNNERHSFLNAVPVIFFWTESSSWDSEKSLFIYIRSVLLNICSSYHNNVDKSKNKHNQIKFIHNWGSLTFDVRFCYRTVFYTESSANYVL